MSRPPSAIQVFEFGEDSCERPMRTFRSRFAERFPLVEEAAAAPFIEVAEAIGGEVPAPWQAEQFLQVAAALMAGVDSDFDCDEESPEVAGICPANDPFIADVFEHLGNAERAPSGRPIVRGSVYCVQQVSGGRIKIGFSTDVAARMSTLNGSGPEPIALLAHARTYDFVERDLHLLLKQHRLHCEWFDDVPEVRAVVSALAKRCDELEQARPDDLPVKLLTGGRK